VENCFDQFKNFLDFFELKLIFLDDFDNFQDLGIENLFGGNFNVFDSGCDVLELFLEFFDEHFQRLFLLVSD
jgi:hypothetical protein